MNVPHLMSTFPPAPEAQVTLANWRTAPFNAWAFHHVREIVPSAEIAHDPVTTRTLAAAPGGGLDGLRIETTNGASQSLDAVLAATDTDGFVVLQDGRVVLERYFNGMTARSPHILMSVSKSMLGLLAGILAGQGVLDPDRLVTHYVPEVAGTVYAGATVRHLLDMRVGIAFAEDYLATAGPIVDYRKSTGWNPLGPGETPTDLRTFLATLKDANGPHGGAFNYVSTNTDLLGWVIERAAGRRYADLMSALLWQPLGAAEPASITVDRLGAPRCAGGMSTTTLDLARVGQLLIEDGAIAGRQIVPVGWLADIERNGDRAAWDSGSFVDYFPGLPMHYRTKWYVEHGAAPLVFGVGIHGQNLFVDRRNAIVIAKFSSQALPMDSERIALTGRAVAAIRQALTRH